MIGAHWSNVLPTRCRSRHRQSCSASAAAACTISPKYRRQRRCLASTESTHCSSCEESVRGPQGKARRQCRLVRKFCGETPPPIPAASCHRYGQATRPALQKGRSNTYTARELGLDAQLSRSFRIAMRSSECKAHAQTLAVRSIPALCNRNHELQPRPNGIDRTYFHVDETSGKREHPNPIFGHICRHL